MTLNEKWVTGQSVFWPFLRLRYKQEMNNVDEYFVSRIDLRFLKDGEKERIEKRRNLIWPSRENKEEWHEGNFQLWKEHNSCRKHYFTRGTFNFCSKMNFKYYNANIKRVKDTSTLKQIPKTFETAELITIKNNNFEQKSFEQNCQPVLSCMVELIWMRLIF